VLGDRVLLDKRAVEDRLLESGRRDIRVPKERSPIVRNNPKALQQDLSTWKHTKYKSITPSRVAPHFSESSLTLI